MDARESSGGKTRLRSRGYQGCGLPIQNAKPITAAARHDSARKTATFFFTLSSFFRDEHEHRGRAAEDRRFSAVDASVAVCAAVHRQEARVNKGGEIPLQARPAAHGRGFSVFQPFRRTADRGMSPGRKDASPWKPCFPGACQWFRKARQAGQFCPTGRSSGRPAVLSRQTGFPAPAPARRALPPALTYNQAT